MDFHTALFALVRQSLQIKKPSHNGTPWKEDAELRSEIRLLYPKTTREMLDKLVPKPDQKDRITASRYYATFLVLDYWRRYKEKKGEGKNNMNSVLEVADERFLITDDNKVGEESVKKKGPGDQIFENTGIGIEKTDDGDITSVTNDSIPDVGNSSTQEKAKGEDGIWI